MKYYEIKQDRRLRNRIEIDGFKGCPNMILDRDMAEQFNKCTTLYVNGTPSSQYPDLIQSPVLMISEKMYQVWKYYDSSVIYKIVVLMDTKNKKQAVYRLVLPETLDVLAEETSYDHNGLLEQIVISKNIDQKKRIFYVSEGVTHHLVVTQDVLESMLAMDSVGICFQELGA